MKDNFSFVDDIAQMPGMVKALLGKKVRFIFYNDHNKPQHDFITDIIAEAENRLFIFNDSSLRRHILSITHLQVLHAGVSAFLDNYEIRVI